MGCITRDDCMFILISQMDQAGFTLKVGDHHCNVMDSDNGWIRWILQNKNLYKVMHKQAERIEKKE